MIVGKINNERRITVKKKPLVTVVSVSLLAVSLAGCGNKDVDTQIDTEDTSKIEVNEREELETGHVSLRSGLRKQILIICRK